MDRVDIEKMVQWTACNFLRHYSPVSYKIMYKYSRPQLTVNNFCFIDIENRDSLWLVCFYLVQRLIVPLSCLAYHYRYPSEFQFHFARTIEKQFILYKLYQRNTKRFQYHSSSTFRLPMVTRWPSG